MKHSLIGRRVPRLCWWILALAGLAPTFACAGRVTTVPPAGDYVIETPIEMIHAEPFVDVRLQPTSPPLQAIPDTGAGMTILDKQRVEDLGLRRLGSMPSRDSSGRRSIVAIHHLDALSVGGATFDNVRVAAIDLRPLGAMLCTSLDMILGTDVLLAGTVEFDYAASVLRLARHGTSLPQRSGGQQIDLVGPAPRIPVELPDGEQAQILIDTGSGGTISISERVLEALGVQPVARVRGMHSVGAHGANRRDAVVFAWPAIPLSGLVVEGISASTGHSMTIGNQVLRLYTLRIDGPGHTATLWRNDEPAVSGWESFGLSWSPRGELGEVVNIVDPSPALEAELAIGDRITAIGQTRLASLSEQERCELSYSWAKDRDRVVLTVQRGSSTRMIELRPRRYF